MIDPNRVWTKERIAAATPKEIEEMAQAIADRLEPSLQGENPQAQGMALAFLTAKWIAGHNQEAHEKLMGYFAKLVYEFVPTIHRKLWETKGPMQ